MEAPPAAQPVTTHPRPHFPSSKDRYFRFTHMKQHVMDDLAHLNNDKSIRMVTLPGISSILKGLRPHELTILSGPTGTGKTTVLSQMSLDYCLQGVRTLWGSFEIRNPRLCQVMLQQIATKPIVSHENTSVEFKRKHEEMLALATERLEKIPMYFMDFFGSTTLEHVLYTMQKAVEVDGVQLIILDNLQFMLSGQAIHSMDKFDLIDRTIGEIRRFCNLFKVHVILVIHPRKEPDNTWLGISSISGTAKSTQEADNIVILQKIGDDRYIEVKKNRWDGDLGKVRIGFDPDSKMVIDFALKPLDQGVAS